MNSIGLRIKEIRLKNNLTQTDFSLKLGIKQANLSHIETYGTKISVSILQKVISNFNVSAEWLLTGNGEMMRNEQQIGDIDNSTVVGANVNGNDISINGTNCSTELLEIIKKQQQQIDKLIDVINKK
jgi:transcriptional regulator with XRE-family HTH domain